MIVIHALKFFILVLLICIRRNNLSLPIFIYFNKEFKIYSKIYELYLIFFTFYSLSYFFEKINRKIKYFLVSTFF